MQNLQDLDAGAYRSFQKVKISGLLVFPASIFQCTELEILDLSDGQISDLPEEITCLNKLKVLFLSNNKFEEYPAILARMPALEMIAFKSNGMSRIGETSFNKQLRWLILTNNKITKLPKSIGQCHKLQKAMLAGNLLTELPPEMRNLTNLELLRISVNQFESLPEWLYSLPCLAFLGFAGNPIKSNEIVDTTKLATLSWTDLQLGSVLGEGASGTIFKALWISQAKEVAVKIFRATMTSDGSPEEEMNACIRAGAHPNLIDTIAEVQDPLDPRRALVFELIPPAYSILGQPPSFETCTRDCFGPDVIFSWDQVKEILSSVALAASHLHSLGISHGDLYAHNTLVNKAGHGLLGDLGAATYYAQSHASATLIQRIEVRAFGHMIEDLFTRCDTNGISSSALRNLNELQLTCISPEVQSRPDFAQIFSSLQAL